LGAFGKSLLTSPRLILSKHDLTLDCVVDKQDLQALSQYYSTKTGAGGYGDLFGLPTDISRVVNIYDFVAVAKHFGPVEP
jgi:hypothetical protein